MTEDFSSPIPAMLPACLLKPRLRSVEASQYLEQAHGLVRHHRTLDRLRWSGGGPVFVRVGRQILYTRGALDDWAAGLLSNSFASTSEYGAR